MLINIKNEDFSNQLRKGMVLIESKNKLKAAFEFLAELIICHKEIKEISLNFEPVINTLTTRQICRIVGYRVNKN